MELSEKILNIGPALACRYSKRNTEKYDACLSAAYFGVVAGADKFKHLIDEPEHYASAIYGHAKWHVIGELDGNQARKWGRLTLLDDFSTVKAKEVNYADEMLDVDVYLKCLNAKQEKVVRMYAMEGKTSSEISKEVGLSETKVEGVYISSIRRMRKIVNGTRFSSTLDNHKRRHDIVSSLPDCYWPHLPNWARLILTVFCDCVEASTKDVVRLAGIALNTARTRLPELTRMGYIQKVRSASKGCPAIYSLLQKAIEEREKK